MNNRYFRELTENQWSRSKFVSVGLGSDYKKIPESLREMFIGPEQLETADTVKSSIYAFNCKIIEETCDLALAYKPNIAFYESYGCAGLTALRETILHSLVFAPEVPVILDAKRADIDSTNIGYVRAIFEYFHADAITVHPYLGAKALKPFLDCAEKGIFVLCRTSNPESDEFQMLPVLVDTEELKKLCLNKNLEEMKNICGWRLLSYKDVLVPMYQYVAMRVARRWNKNGNCGLVVGANYPEELRIVRRLVGDDMPILNPAIGAQQKDVPLEWQVKRVVEAGQNSKGKGLIVNASRSIIFSDDPRRETIKLNNLVNQYRRRDS